MSSPARVTILLLADHSAQWRLGGLTQVERLRRACADTWGREVNVAVWTFGGPDLDLEGPVIVLHTSLVVAAGGLRGLLPRLPRLAADDPKVRQWTEAYEVFRSALRGSAGNTSGPFWEVIADGGDVGAVEDRLFRSLGKRTDGFVSRSLNRPISIAITRVLAKTPLRPDHWTLLMLPLPFVMAAVLASGTAGGFVAGTLIFHLASVLDGCDGELARLTFQSTRYGERLDNAVDQLGNLLLPLSLGFGLVAQTGRAEYRWQALACVALMLIGFGLAARFTTARTGAGHWNDLGTQLVDEAAASGLRRRAMLIAFGLLKRDSYALLFVVLAAAGRPSWILHLLFAGAAGHAVVLGLARVRDRWRLASGAL